MNDLRHVELVWVKMRIENRSDLVDLPKSTLSIASWRLVIFAPGSIFAFARWSANDFGTVISRIDILRAVRAGERCLIVPFVRPEEKT